MGGVLDKIITGGSGRRSRFHTEDDQFVGWSKLLRELPLSAVQKLQTALTGRRPGPTA